MISLFHGDCLELMGDIADQSIDLILCDLPYETTRNEWDFMVHLPAMWAHYKRVCRGAIVLTSQTPFDKVLGASNLRMLRYEWIWDQSKANFRRDVNRLITGLLTIGIVACSFLFTGMPKDERMALINQEALAWNR